LKAPTVGRQAAEESGMARRAPRLGTAIVIAGLLSVVLVSDWARDLGSTIDIARLEARRAGLMLYYRLGLAMPGMPDLDRLDERLAEKGLAAGSAVLVRIFKQESELELWMSKGDRFEHFATYPICKWAGALGPKQHQGDHQSPEGFYTVAAGQLNPQSRWHRSFDVGYPNIFDRAHGRTGDFIMVHGGCSSVGCFAVTNEAVGEIWTLVTAALNGGQKRFQVQSFPFRMTVRNLEVHGKSPWSGFWADLKPGYDLFEATRVPPVASVCGKRYVFRQGTAGNDGSAPVAAGCPGRPPAAPSGS
jgi:murein L,D-transpeptidase YafK